MHMPLLFHLVCKLEGPQRTSERTVLSQCSQDQRHATKPLDIQVPNIYRDKVL